MAVEWLVLWGATKAAGALVKPVLEDLAKDIAKDEGDCRQHHYIGDLRQPQDETERNGNNRSYHCRMATVPGQMFP